MSARIAYSGVAVLLLGSIAAYGASPPNAMDLPPSNIIPGTVDLTQPTLPQARPAERTEEPTGNPLWAIPLSALTATRDRPIFVPSRRPPAPAVAGPPPVQRPVAVVAPPAELERPQLTLVGVIANETEGFAVFLDQETNQVVRLRTGQDHAGWVLSSVKGREAVLQKGRETATMALPIPGGGEAMPASLPPGLPTAPPPVPASAPVSASGKKAPPGPGMKGLLQVPPGTPIDPRTGEPNL